MGRCVVPLCDHSSSDHHGNRPLHNLPTKSSALKKRWYGWRSLVRKLGRNARLKKHSFTICTEHFDIDSVTNYTQQMESGNVVKCFRLAAQAVAQYQHCRPLAEQAARKLAYGIDRQPTYDDTLEMEEADQEEDNICDTIDESGGYAAFDESVVDEERELQQDDSLVMVSIASLVQLLVLCASCKRDIDREKAKVTECGMVATLRYRCVCGHTFKWSSAPPGRTVYQCNVLFSSVLLFSGNIICQVLKSVMRHQGKYLFCAVNHVYGLQEQQEQESSTTPVVIGGDGRCDSMGHYSHYLSYGFFDVTRRKLLLLKLVSRTQANNSSAAM